MGRKLYVGNFPYSATEDQLREHFSTAGAVDTVAVVMDKATGQPRGFAFVEMATDKDAENAINTLNDAEFGGRRLTVNEARPQKEFGGGGGGRGGGRGGGGYGGGGGGGRQRW